MNGFEPNDALPPPSGLHAEGAEAGIKTAEPPFWNYDDLVVFGLLMLPSLGAGLLIVNLLSSFIPFGPAASAARLLSMQFLGYAIWFACLCILLKVRYHRPFWRSLGWVLPTRGLTTAILAGPALALGLAVLALALDTPHVKSPIEKLISDRRSLLTVGIVASTLGPLCEEMAFRGFMLPLLVRSFGGFFGVLLTAVPFALIHGPQYQFQWQNLLILTLAACAFGWVRLRSGSVIPAIVMHGLYNLTLFVGYASQKDFSAQW